MNKINLSRKFTAKNNQYALDSVNAIVEIAEREGHYPDVHLTSCTEVEIVIFTDSVGGVTQNDPTLAHSRNEIVRVVLSPLFVSVSSYTSI